MDNIIDYLKSKFSDEFILGSIHSLLHADDTLVMSLSFETFKEKCNALVEILKQKKLSLNLPKSSYMALFTDKSFIKSDIELSVGVLPCKSVLYLVILE